MYDIVKHPHILFKRLYDRCDHDFRIEPIRMSVHGEAFFDSKNDISTSHNPKYPIKSLDIGSNIFRKMETNVLYVLSFSGTESFDVSFGDKMEIARPYSKQEKVAICDSDYVIKIDEKHIIIINHTILGQTMFSPNMVDFDVIDNELLLKYNETNDWKLAIELIAL